MGRRRRRLEARVVALVAAGLVAANAVAGVALAIALQTEAEGAQLRAVAAAEEARETVNSARARVAALFDSPGEAMAAGAMVFALSGFASVLVMRLSAAPGRAPSPARRGPGSDPDEARQP